MTFIQSSFSIFFWNFFWILTLLTFYQTSWKLKRKYLIHRYFIKYLYDSYWQNWVICRVKDSPITFFVRLCDFSVINGYLLVGFQDTNFGSIMPKQKKILSSRDWSCWSPLYFSMLRKMIFAAGHIYLLYLFRQKWTLKGHAAGRVRIRHLITLLKPMTVVLTIAWSKQNFQAEENHVAPLV